MNTRSVEMMLVGYLRTRVSAPVTVEPEQDFTPPLLAVERIAGNHDGFRLDYPMIDVDAFAVNRGSAEALSWETHDAFLALKGTIQRGLVIARVDVDAAPRHVDYGNRNVRRFSSTYTLTIHLQ